jgi:hypothetical protein
MTGLEPRADQAVRDAVDAFLEGRLSPEYAGETVFETKNSRYRLMDGILFSAPDASLVGAELVGWLIESAKRSIVESAWQATSRAVLVDRKRGRHIIVTSSTRMLHLEEESPPSGSSEDQAGSSVHPPIWEESANAAAPSLPPPSAPPPSSHRYAPLPALNAPSRNEPSPTTRPPPSATPLPRVHAPPRPMLQRIPQATAPKPLARPLPYPSAPPRRISPLPSPSAVAQQLGPLPPPGRLPLPPPTPPPYHHLETLDEGVEAIEADDEIEPTDPDAPPFLLARPITRPASVVPAPPSSQPFPLARAVQRGALLR